MLLDSSRVFEGIYTPLSRLVSMFNDIYEQHDAGTQARSGKHKKRRWREGGLIKCTKARNTANTGLCIQRTEDCDTTMTYPGTRKCILLLLTRGASLSRIAANIKKALHESPWNNWRTYFTLSRVMSQDSTATCLSTTLFNPSPSLTMTSSTGGGVEYVQSFWGWLMSARSGLRAHYPSQYQSLDIPNCNTRCHYSYHTLQISGLLTDVSNMECNTFPREIMHSRGHPVGRIYWINLSWAHWNFAGKPRSVQDAPVSS